MTNSSWRVATKTALTRYGLEYQAALTEFEIAFQHAATYSGRQMARSRRDAQIRQAQTKLNASAGGHAVGPSSV